MYYVNKLHKNWSSLVRKPIPSCNAIKDKGEGEKEEKYFPSFSFIYSMHCKMTYIKYVQSIDNPSSKAIGCQ